MLETVSEVTEECDGATQTLITEHLAAWELEFTRYFPEILRISKVTVLKEYQTPDYDDVFERPPFAVLFSTTIHNVHAFAYIGIHVKPSDAAREIDALINIYNRVMHIWRIKDAVLGGDFNAGCQYVGPRQWKNIRLRSDKRFRWLIGDDADTTIACSRCPYDRFVIAGSRLIASYVSNSAQPFRFYREYNMTRRQAKKISDHVPIEMKLTDQP
ncbi:Deoxyribonuclease gamma [Lamellibrachia satsuma]|nr:Deoxyribonuclease gamma [Lamellibrachia satsuma]